MVCWLLHEEFFLEIESLRDNILKKKVYNKFGKLNLGTFKMQNLTLKFAKKSFLFQPKFLRIPYSNPHHFIQKISLLFLAFQREEEKRDSLKFPHTS